jgi:hypothetical protein
MAAKDVSLRSVVNRPMRGGSTPEGLRNTARSERSSRLAARDWNDFRGVAAAKKVMATLAATKAFRSA